MGVEHHAGPQGISIRAAAPAGCSLLHTSEPQSSITSPFVTANMITNIAGDTHASRGFQKQISRAHRLQRTPLCWCSVRKYRHGSMAPSTKGSSSVLQAGGGDLAVPVPGRGLQMHWQHRACHSK